MIDFTRMLSDSPGTPGRRQQMPRTTRSICTPAAERRIERIDDFRVDQRIHLHPDRRRPAGPGVIRSRPRYAASMRLRSVIGEMASCSSFGRLDIAGDEVEDAGDVAGDHRIGGEERQVGIDACGDRVIIAGADVHVGRRAAAFAPHDQRQLGVRLQLDEAVDDLHAGALQVARPADVGLLVEARLELDQRGHRLAGLGGLGERTDDRAVGRGAVERLLDRDDVGIARGLIEELHHHVEQFVGVVDDDVLLADRGETVAAMVADALGKARVVRRELRGRADRPRRAGTSSLSASMPSTRKTSSSPTAERALARSA